MIIQSSYNMTDAEIAGKRGTELKRKGILLSDPDVLHAMEEGKSPRYIPVRFSKDGTPTGGIATLEEFGYISRHIDKVLLDGECGGQPLF